MSTDEGAVTAIAGLAQEAQEYTVGEPEDDLFLVHRNMVDPRKPEPMAHPLNVGTLRGLVDYLLANKDGLDLPKHALHIRSATQVVLIGPLSGRFRVRECPMEASFRPEGYDDGVWHPVEETVIALQHRFVPTAKRAELLRALGSIDFSAEVGVEDDGVSQTVVAKKGGGIRQREGFANPVMLAPFRTFREIQQPESPFIVRINGAGEDSEVAFFLADGGNWETSAIEDIGEYLSGKVPGDLPILG